MWYNENGIPNATSGHQEVIENAFRYLSKSRNFFKIGAHATRMITGRKSYMRNRNMQFHRRRTSKYENREVQIRTGPRTRKSPVRAAAENGVIFNWSPYSNRAVSAAGRPGTARGRFRTPWARDRSGQHQIEDHDDQDDADEMMIMMMMLTTTMRRWRW